MKFPRLELKATPSPAITNRAGPPKSPNPSTNMPTPDETLHRWALAVPSHAGRGVRFPTPNPLTTRRPSRRASPRPPPPPPAPAPPSRTQPNPTEASPSRAGRPPRAARQPSPRCALLLSLAPVPFPIGVVNPPHPTRRLGLGSLPPQLRTLPPSHRLPRRALPALPPDPARRWWPPRRWRRSKGAEHARTLVIVIE